MLPLWIVLLGWAITAGALLLAARRVQGEKVAGRLALLGVIAAFMLVVQSVPLLPMGYHLNLTVLSGIILGPAVGLIAAFIVNLILALVGHGGVTVVGLNTLVFGVEIVLGVFLFRALHRTLRGTLGSGLAAGGATILSLLASTALMLGIVAAAGVAPGWQVHREPARLVLPPPFADAPIVEVPRPEEQVPVAVQMERFATLVLVLGLIGWPIEAAATGLIVAYLHSVRPQLLEAEPGR